MEFHHPPALTLSKDVKWFLAILLVIGIVLLATVIPGVFIIDEDNYLVSVLALRHGGFTPPGLDELTPSPSLLYFDPDARGRIMTTHPFALLVAPLYAFLALPFSYFGWYGLVFLNILSFLIAAALVLFLTRAVANSAFTPWIAAATFVLGSYSIEYAQGVWPHMLSAGLATAAFFLAVKSLGDTRYLYAGLAGLTFGIAVGVREQNILFAGCTGLGLLMFGKRRVATLAAFAVGLAIPLVAISFINLHKFAFFHPFPKFFSYASDVSVTHQESPVLEPLRAFWAKVVDFSYIGTINDPVKASLFYRAPGSGAVLLYGIVKKSLLQSAPWIGLAIIGCVTAWIPKPIHLPEARRLLKMTSLVVLPTLVLFSLAGSIRTDALAYNQRYFLELLPFCAVALALLMDHFEIKPTYLIAGFAAGGLIVMGVLQHPSAFLKFSGQLKIPLVLSLLLIFVWVFPARFIHRNIPSLALGACLGWALVIHLGTDLVGSRFRRSDNDQRLQILKNVVPDHSALFTYWGNKDAAGPLQLERDVIIVDVHADDGHDAPQLINELLAQRRKIFILLIDIPDEMLTRILQGRSTRRFSESYMNFVEVLSQPPG
ncbi:MAG: hypothetical protein HYY49_00780 [Ignavibacteriales bacterium]|nr:hypothetical protein [Ignavibacteriales bacterium]